MANIVILTSNESGPNSLIDINNNFNALNVAKAEISGQVFTGNISALNLSGNNTGDQIVVKWTTISVDTPLVNNTGYIVDSVTMLNLSCTPTVVGSQIWIVGRGTGGWKLNLAGQTVYMGIDSATTAVNSTYYRDSMLLLCTAPNEFTVIGVTGNPLLS